MRARRASTTSREAPSALRRTRRRGSTSSTTAGSVDGAAGAEERARGDRVVFIRTLSPHSSRRPGSTAHALRIEVLCLRKLGIRLRDVLQVTAAEISTTLHGAVKVCLLEVGALEVRLLEARVREVG